MSTRSRILVIGLVLIVVSAGLAYGLPQWFGVSPPEVSVKAEPVFYIHDGFHMGVPHDGGFVITNSMILAALVTIVLGLLSFFATRNMQVVPRGFQNFVEMVVEGMYNTFGSVDRQYIARFWPMVGTIFFYVLFSNWLALIPGVLSIGYRVPESELHHASAKIAPGTLAHFDADTQGSVSDVVVPVGGAVMNGQEEGGEEGAQGEEHMVLVPYLRSPSADLNNTVMLGVLAFLYAQFWGFKQLGLGYLYKFVPFRDGAIGLFVGFFEFLSEFVRIVSYAFRLFGNIFAGEVLLLVMAFLFPLLPLPFLGLETFVGFIQAFVFAILVMAFSSLATQGHGDHHADEPHHAEVGGTTRQNPAH